MSEPMDIDDLRRDKYGVVACIRDSEDGKSRVILDDVTNQSENGQGEWSHQTFVTWKEYNSKALGDLDLSEKEFAAFGHYVLARLLAVKKVGNRS